MTDQAKSLCTVHSTVKQNSKFVIDSCKRIFKQPFKCKWIAHIDHLQSDVCCLLEAKQKKKKKQERIYMCKINVRSWVVFIFLLQLISGVIAHIYREY